MYGSKYSQSFAWSQKLLPPLSGLNVGDIEAPRTAATLAYLSEMVNPMSPTVKSFFEWFHNMFPIPIFQVALTELLRMARQTNASGWTVKQVKIEHVKTLFASLGL